MTHVFEVEVAKKYGLNAAIVLNLLRTWIAHNAANKKNVREGRTWTYNSTKAWSELLPYLSEKQVRTAIDLLLGAGLVVKANFNENTYDRTLWYALTEEGNAICPTGQMDSPHRSDRNAPTGESVDSIKTNQSSSPEENELTLEAGRFVEWFIALLARTGAPEPRLTPTIRAGWADAYEKLVRIDNKTKGEIAKVCEWARGDTFWRTNFYSPTKLRERKDGVSRYDLFLSKLSTHAPASNSRPNGRSFEMCGDYSGIRNHLPEE